MASLLGIARGSRTSPPAPDLAERERGGGVGDDQVAGECDLTTAAHGVAVDRSDDWFGEVLPAGGAGESVLGGYPRGFTLPGPDEVVPGGERGRAGAGEDGDPEVGVGELGVEDLIEFVVRGRCERVPGFGDRCGGGR